MRERSLVAIFCALFLLFSSIAYSAPNPGRKGSKTVSGTAQKNSTALKQSKNVKKLTGKATNKGKRRAVGSAKARNSAKKHVAKKRLSRTPIEVVEDEQDPEFMEYRVQKGDTVEKIAEKFDVDRQDILDLNAIRKSSLTPGLKLVIPKDIQDSSSDDDPVVLHTMKPLKALKSWKNEEERGVLVKVARSFSGAPYKYGGDSVRGLDCSAFVKKMYEIFDVQLPRTAREQFQAGMKINKEELTTGDLVFFRTHRSAKHPTHVGIYIGDGKFIHASSVLRRGVKVDSLNEGYFDRTYTGAVRVKTLDKDRSGPNS